MLLQSRTVQTVDGLSIPSPTSFSRTSTHAMKRIPQRSVLQETSLSTWYRATPRQLDPDPDRLPHPVQSSKPLIFRFQCSKPQTDPRLLVITSLCLFQCFPVKLILYLHIQQDFNSSSFPQDFMCRKLVRLMLTVQTTSAQPYMYWWLIPPPRACHPISPTDEMAAVLAALLDPPPLKPMSWSASNLSNAPSSSIVFLLFL